MSRVSTSSCFKLLVTDSAYLLLTTYTLESPQPIYILFRPPSPHKAFLWKTRHTENNDGAMDCSIDIHILMQDVAVCKDRAHSLCEKLSGSTYLGLNYDTV